MKIRNFQNVFDIKKNAEEEENWDVQCEDPNVMKVQTEISQQLFDGLPWLLFPWFHEFWDQNTCKTNDIPISLSWYFLFSAN